MHVCEYALKSIYIPRPGRAPSPRRRIGFSSVGWARKRKAGAAWRALKPCTGTRDVPVANCAEPARYAGCQRRHRLQRLPTATIGCNGCSARALLACATPQPDTAVLAVQPRTAVSALARTLLLTVASRADSIAYRLTGAGAVPAAAASHAAGRLPLEGVLWVLRVLRVLRVVWVLGEQPGCSGDSGGSGYLGHSRRTWSSFARHSSVAACTFTQTNQTTAAPRQVPPTA